MFVLSALVSLPLALVAGVLMTPLLWRLESMVGIELAGHSGPSDWILLTISGVFTVSVTALYVWTTTGKVRRSGDPAR